MQYYEVYCNNLGMQPDINTLSPRRAEIVEIVREQRLVSFDFIYRRFLSLSRRQIAYDLEYLVAKSFLVKKGVTRGALYAPKI